MKIINKHITNLAQIIGCKQNSGRLHEWDEENRLRFVLGEKFTGYYGYNADGERVYKLTGQSILGQVNSGSTKAQAIFDDVVLYPNPYMVVTRKGYTKHYYAGMERIATVIGGGGFGDMVSPTDKLSSQHDQDIVKTFYTRYLNYDPFFHQGTLSQPEKTEDIHGNPHPELEYQCTPTELVMVDILNPPDILLGSINQHTKVNGQEKEVYFYHGDHLGSANWITDYTGAPIQYIHYAPYGELIDNQVPYGYDERYKFTGKERDAETGYDYFGARFYWQAGTWLSVDPLTGKYPGISPYVYCGWNPVKNIDPDGRELISSFNLDPHNQPYSCYKKNWRLNDYSKRNYDNNSPVIHFFAHGAPNRIRLKDGTAINTPQKMFNYLYEQSQEFKASCSTGKPSVLVLHSCSTGSGENSFAQQLSADELFSNTLVIAPSSVLEVGSKETISNAGFWIAFYKGKQVGTINGHDTPWYKFWGKKKEAVQLKDLFNNMTPEQIFKFFNVDLDK